MMAFFIIMKKIYFILLLISLVIPIYNYDQDDWVVIYEPDNIISLFFTGLTQFTFMVAVKLFVNFKFSID